MKLFHTTAVMALTLTTLTSAAPVEQRQATIVGTVNSAVTTLQNTVSQNEQAIALAASTVQSSVSASVSVAAAVNADIAAIVAALGQAATTITGVTAGAAAGLASGLITLTQDDLNMLAADLVQIQAILSGIGATLTLTVTNLTPDIQTAIGGEVTALEAAIAPFMAPVTALVTAVENAKITSKLTITGIAAALSGLQLIASGLAGAV